METSPSQYDPPFPSCTKISGKNGAQILQNLCPLNFDDGFEFGYLENPPMTAISSKSNEFNKLTQKITPVRAFFGPIYRIRSLWRKRRSWGFQGRRNPIHLRNWSGTIFGCSVPHLSTNFARNSRTVGLMGWATDLEFNIRIESFCGNYGNVQICQNAVTTKCIFLDQFIEFVRFGGTGGYGFRGGQIRIRRQN